MSSHEFNPYNELENVLLDPEVGIIVYAKRFRVWIKYNKIK